MSYLFQQPLRRVRAIVKSSGDSIPLVRRFVVIGTESNGSFIEEQLLALSLIEMNDLGIGEPHSWIMGRQETIHFDNSQTVGTSSPPAGQPFGQFDSQHVEVSLWLATNANVRLTLIGHDVAESAALLQRALQRSNRSLPTFDVIDTSSLSQAANLHPSTPSLSGLLDALAITNRAPGTVLGDSLAIAAATEAVARTLSPADSATDLQAALAKLVTAISPPSAPTTRITGSHSVKSHITPQKGQRSDVLDTERFSTTFLRVFFSLYFLMGLGLIALFPPFQSPDAFAHFDRAVGISTGQLVTSNVKQFSGSTLPAGVLQTEAPFSNIPFNPVQKVNRAEFKVGYRQLWKSPGSFTAYSTGAYLPFLYAPQVLGVWIGKMVSNHILISSYLAELMNLLAFIALTMWAMSQLPKRIALPLGAVLLLPTVSSLATSVNPDALFIALAVVFAASCYNSYQDHLDASTSNASARHSRSSSRRQYLGHLSTRYGFAYISLFFMVIEKPPYLVLALLLPIADFYSNLRKYLAKVSVFVGSSLLVYAVWTKFGAHGNGGPGVGWTPSPYRQLEYVVTHPFFYFKVLFETFRWNGWAFIQEFLAGIGWLDVRFPNWFYESVSLIIVVLVASTAIRRRDKLWKFLYTLLVPFIAFQAIFLSFYVIYSPYQWPLIDGFQGRYLIPLVTIFIVLLGLDGRRSPRLRVIANTAVNYSDVILVSLESLIACEFFVTLLTRYWN